MKDLATIRKRKGWVGNIIMTVLKDHRDKALSTDEVFILVNRYTADDRELIVYSHNEVRVALKALNHCGDINDYYVEGRIYYAYCDKRLDDDGIPVRDYR